MRTLYSRLHKAGPCPGLLGDPCTLQYASRVQNTRHARPSHLRGSVITIYHAPNRSLPLVKKNSPTVRQSLPLLLRQRPLRLLFHIAPPFTLTICKRLRRQGLLTGAVSVSVSAVRPLNSCRKHVGTVRCVLTHTAKIAALVRLTLERSLNLVDLILG